MGWIFWLILAAAFIHVIEEYLGHWVTWVHRYVPSVTKMEFGIVTSVFIALCCVSALIGVQNLIFSLSIACLIFIYAIVQIIALFIGKRYTPGIISAIVLYLSLSIISYYLAADSGQINIFLGAKSVLLGMSWLLLLVIYKLARMYVKRT